MAINYAWYTVYIVVLIAGLGFALVRKEVVLAYKRKFFTGKGYVYIRMWMPDRQEVEDFINIKKDNTISFFGRMFIFDAKVATFREAMPLENPINVEVDGEGKLKRLIKKVTPWKVKKDGKVFRLNPAHMTKKGKFPVYNFRWDKAEPIDPYQLDRAIPSDLFENAIMRAKAQGAFAKFLSQNSKIMMLIMGAAVAAAAAAYFSFETNAAIDVLLSRGIALG